MDLRSVGSIALALTLASVPSVAHAGDGAMAEALFQQGRAAAQKGDWTGACGKFHESYRADPTVGTVFNMGDCEEHLGRLATAWEYFREVVQRLPAGDERIAIAQARATALEKRVPTLSVKLAPNAPAGTKVLRGDTELGAASLGTPLPVDPGDITIEVRAPGTQPAKFPVHLAEGEKKSLDVAPGAADASAPPPVTGATDSGGSSSKRTWGWVAGGAGVAGLAVGTIAGVLTLGKKSTVNKNCDDAKRCNQTGIDAVNSGGTIGTISTIGFISGAVLTGLGAYLLLSGDDQSATKTSLVPAVGPQGMSVGLVSIF